MIDYAARSKRVPWREGRVFSVKLRNDWFVLLQMLSSPNVAVFNEFRSEDDWDDIELDAGNVLFVCPVLKAFLKRSQLHFLTNIKAAHSIDIPAWKLNTRGPWENVTVWPGTPHERVVMALGGEGRVGLYRSFCEPGNVGDEYIPISITDYDLYLDIETAHLRNYPEFNERLFLCSELECNIDPLKELMFRRPLDLICRPYVGMMTGERIAKYGY
jgi:hypothetical protein